jgi:RecB family endonuclease NucS
MYKVNIKKKSLSKVPETSFSSLNLKERFDIQEWIENTPEILGEEFLIVGKELILPSGKRLDLLSIDKQGSLVIVELKRDDSGSDVEWNGVDFTLPERCNGVCPLARRVEKKALQ